MKLIYLLLFVVSVLSFTVDEQEIFQLQKELENFNKSTNFYDFLELKQTSNVKQINSKFKKLSKLYHPDKHLHSKDIKKLTQRYQLIQLISNILKNSEKRKTYDYYLSNGFPKYSTKGWGFYRFKPSFIVTLIGLYLIIGVNHYIILRINHKLKINKISKLIQTVKANQTELFKEEIIKDQDSDVSFFISQTNEVYVIEQDDGKDVYIKLTIDNIPIPSIQSSLLVKFPISLWNFSLGRSLGRVTLNKPNDSVEKLFTKPNSANEVKKKKPKGKKLTLPNGKVIYSK